MKLFVRIGGSECGAHKINNCACNLLYKYLATTVNVLAVFSPPPRLPPSPLPPGPIFVAVASCSSSTTVLCATEQMGLLFQGEARRARHSAICALAWSEWKGYGTCWLPILPLTIIIFVHIRTVVS